MAARRRRRLPLPILLPLLAVAVPVAASLVDPTTTTATPVVVAASAAFVVVPPPRARRRASSSSTTTTATNPIVAARRTGGPSNNGFLASAPLPAAVPPPPRRRSSSSSYPVLASSSSPSEEEAGGSSPIPTEEELRSILRVAIEASRKAGDIIVGQTAGSAGGGVEVTERKANARDLLTEIDPLCEKTIRDAVLSRYPNHDFLGEEDVPPGKDASAAAVDALLSDPSASDYLWIVDPIDGTTNFVHGMPLCMPSVAVAYKGEVVAGVIFDPHRNETFTSIKGRGSFLNGRPIRVGTETDLSDAVIAMGSPPAMDSMEMSLRGVEALMPKCRTIRMLGSAALMLAWVACGRLTCYWEYDLSSWDVSAGALLVREAGGRFTDLDGTDWELRTRKICASNGGGNVHDEILDALEDAGVV